MPELPEVEIVRRGLEPALVGRAFARVEQRRPDLRFPLPESFPARLTGRKVERLERRGKYLLAHLSDGQLLLMHLGMTGCFTVHKGGSGERGGGAKLGVHEHVVFHMRGGPVVSYEDPRRFGFMVLIPPGEEATHPLLRHLGVEPLGEDLDAAYLARRALGKRTDLKAFLSDQRIIAGLGNIYVCEALYRARLSPTRGAATIATAKGKPNARAEALVRAVREVLDDAIGAGGSSMRDYRHADGQIGSFQHRFCVYGREGKPCLHKGCGGTVERIVQGGRSTFYCPRCQR
ncbi:MAG TPA: bifunctional DNA-formamidopyrimidine glycosylase/DNA-(apurinic or apyrimidinic site) lyase [Hyphomicrobium sp.]|nr:bifunctional DNA-formamidopyrimidine glycosylase/DNA-(apurinic or apyrimidinic site) lyase [Hyphomicrobium sp.]